MQGNISVSHNAVKILMNLHLNRWQNVKSYNKIKFKDEFVKIENQVFWLFVNETRNSTIDYWQTRPPKWRPHHGHAAAAAATFYLPKSRQGTGDVTILNVSIGSVQERRFSFLKLKLFGF